MNRDQIEVSDDNSGLQLGRPKEIAAAAEMFGQGGWLSDGTPPPKPQVVECTIAPAVGFEGPKPLQDGTPKINVALAKGLKPIPQGALPKRVPTINGDLIDRRLGQAVRAVQAQQDPLVLATADYLARRPWEKWYRLTTASMGLPKISQYPPGVWESITKKARELLSPDSPFLADWVEFCRRFKRSGWSAGKIAQFAVFHAICSAGLLVMQDLKNQSTAVDEVTPDDDDPMANLPDEVDD